MGIPCHTRSSTADAWHGGETCWRNVVVLSAPTMGPAPSRKNHSAAKTALGQSKVAARHVADASPATGPAARQGRDKAEAGQCARAIHRHQRHGGQAQLLGRLGSQIGERGAQSGETMEWLAAWRWGCWEGKMQCCWPPPSDRCISCDAISGAL